MDCYEQSIVYMTWIRVTLFCRSSYLSIYLFLFIPAVSPSQLNFKLPVIACVCARVPVKVDDNVVKYDCMMFSYN